MVKRLNHRMSFIGVLAENHRQLNVLVLAFDLGNKVMFNSQYRLVWPSIFYLLGDGFYPENLHVTAVLIRLGNLREHDVACSCVSLRREDKCYIY